MMDDVSQRSARVPPGTITGPARRLPLYYSRFTLQVTAGDVGSTWSACVPKKVAILAWMARSSEA